MPKETVFEKYAHEYDLITDAAAREEYHSREIQALADRFQPRSVLDAGCASGLTSILFARQGINTVGLDRSRKMLDVARARTAGLDLPLAFRHGRFEALPKALDGEFDLIVCLANSISGLRTQVDLRKVMGNFRRVLTPGGHLLIQTLNYASIKEGEFFPIKATRNGGIIWLRYARRLGRTLEVHVIRVDNRGPQPAFEPFVNQFDNFDVGAVEQAVRVAGLVDVRKYGDLYLKKRFGRKSRDLVLVARRKD